MGIHLLSVQLMLEYLRVQLPDQLFIDLPNDILCKIAICPDDPTYLTFWQQVEMTSELQLDLKDTMKWGNK